MFVAPERRMSSWVMTKMAAAVLESFCSFFETEVTSTFIKSSMLVLVRSFGCVCGACPMTGGLANASKMRILQPENRARLTKVGAAWLHTNSSPSAFLAADQPGTTTEMVYAIYF